jgi:hypothetical protein
MNGEMLYQLILAAGAVYLVLCSIIVAASLVATVSNRIKNKLRQRKERKCEP